MDIQSQSEIYKIQLYTTAAHPPDFDWIRSDTEIKWRIVGRPCGQFQGDRKLDSVDTTFFIFFRSKCRPIMIEYRHARDASIARTREGRGVIVREST